MFNSKIHLETNPREKAPNAPGLERLLRTDNNPFVKYGHEVSNHYDRWSRLLPRSYNPLGNRKHWQELERPHELIKPIIETMPQPILVLTEEFRVQTGNRSFYKTFGMEPVVALDRVVYSLGSGQWDQTALRVLLEEVLPEHNDFIDREIEDLCDGEPKSFVLSGHYIREESDSARLIILSFTDTTQRKKTEAALMQLEKQAIVTGLAASIAHEINNPLEAITNLLYLASTSDDAEAAKAYTAKALQEVTGLGMWVSVQLLERLKGDMRIWSSTRPGMSGTAFSLFLPLQK